MLFMGSEKYPDENAFEKYLSEHGGSSNAFTSSESTNYYFDVTKDHLKGALDLYVNFLSPCALFPFNSTACLRFAQFFISPLMAIEATARELKAVNSGTLRRPETARSCLTPVVEDKKNFQADSWRNSQILKVQSNPAHPFHKFSTGNLETLDTEPKKNNVDVRQALQGFHDQYYSANLMCLCLLGAGSCFITMC